MDRAELQDALRVARMIRSGCEAASCSEAHRYNRLLAAAVGHLQQKQAASNPPGPRDYWVTVCAECLTAMCWHGDVICEAHETAGTVDKRASELRELRREHESNFSVDRLRSVEGRVRWVS